MRTSCPCPRPTRSVTRRLNGVCKRCADWPEQIRWVDIFDASQGAASAIDKFKIYLNRTITVGEQEPERALGRVGRHHRASSMPRRKWSASCSARVAGTGPSRELLEQVHDAGHVFDEGLILATLGDFDAAEPAFEASIFNGPDFATSYWPTISVRYLFRRVWDAIPDARWRISMLDRINEAHG